MKRDTSIRYVALDAIQPGDAILSAVRTPASMAIRLATGSLTASHVAIAIHPLIWFEAVGSGLRFKVHVPELIWSGDRLRFGIEIPRGSHFAIRRPDLRPSRQDSLVERARAAKGLIRIASGLAFLDYARPAAFLPMLRLGLGEVELAKRLARSLERQNVDAFAGPFCSWLVAGCYEAMGQRLFDLEPHRVSPAAIERSRRFNRITTVIRGVPIDGRPAFVDLMTRFELSVRMTKSIIAAADNGAVLAKVVTGFNAKLRRGLESWWRQLGKPLPTSSAASLDDIAEKQKRDFAEWQMHLIAALELGYSSISPHLESIPDVAKCRVSCAREAAGGWPCGVGNGCSMATAAFLDAHEQLQEIFPPPPFSRQFAAPDQP